METKDIISTCGIGLAFAIGIFTPFATARNLRIQKQREQDLLILGTMRILRAEIQGLEALNPRFEEGLNSGQKLGELVVWVPQMSVFQSSVQIIGGIQDSGLLGSVFDCYHLASLVNEVIRTYNNTVSQLRELEHKRGHDPDLQTTPLQIGLRMAIDELGSRRQNILDGLAGSYRKLKEQRIKTIQQIDAFCAREETRLSGK